MCNSARDIYNKLFSVKTGHVICYGYCAAKALFSCPGMFSANKFGSNVLAACVFGLIPNTKTSSKMTYKLRPPPHTPEKGWRVVLSSCPRMFSANKFGTFG